MAAAVPWSLYWLTESSRGDWLNSNLIEKRCCEKKIGMMAKNKKGRKTHSHRFLRASHGRGQRWRAFAPFICIDWGQPAWLTEYQFNWKKILWEKSWEWWQTNKNERKLTVVTFCQQVKQGDGGSGPLLHLLTEGGPPARLK